MKINIVARKRLEINILTPHKLPDPPPSPAESNGCCKCVSSVGFSWGVLRGVLGEYVLSGFHV